MFLLAVLLGKYLDFRIQNATNQLENAHTLW
jgi:ribosomal protein L29